MTFLQIIIGVFALASTLGAASAIFYAVRQTTIITTLERSNKAYEERNAQLERAIIELKADFNKRIAELEGKITTLERIKTPPLKPLIDLVSKNHTEVMQALRKVK